ncbi:MAG: hypothetical protein AB2L24_06895 [Mangrovibacterium sp.]
MAATFPDRPPLSPYKEEKSFNIYNMVLFPLGRDFYDLMFLLVQTNPNYDFLSRRCGIHNLQEFKQATNELLKTVDLRKKQEDFEHLLFNKANCEHEQ